MLIDGSLIIQYMYNPLCIDLNSRILIFFGLSTSYIALGFASGNIRSLGFIKTDFKLTTVQ